MSILDVLEPQELAMASICAPDQQPQILELARAPDCQAAPLAAGQNPGQIVRY